MFKASKRVAAPTLALSKTKVTHNDCVLRFELQGISTCNVEEGNTNDQ
jgi:hypothetical protein